MRSFCQGRRVGEGSRRVRRHRSFRTLLAVAIGVLAAAAPATAVAHERCRTWRWGTPTPPARGSCRASPAAPPECGQSLANYPHLVAAALKLSLTDVSCSGAKTENFTVAQFPDQPPQFDALWPSTEVVTVGMGGNDNNLFATLVEGCTVLDYRQAERRGSVQGSLRRLRHENLRREHRPAGRSAARDPQALAESKNLRRRVSGNHADQRLLPDGDPVDDRRPALVSLQGSGARQRDPGAGGAHKQRDLHRNVLQSFGHNACEAVGTRWIEPLFGSLTGVAVHPNALGQEHDAQDVELAMRLTGVR